MHYKDRDECESIIKEDVIKLDLQQFDYIFNVTHELNFFKVTHKLLLELDVLAPYGEGFDFPIFKMRNIELSENPRPFGNRMQKDRTPHVEFKVLNRGVKTKRSQGKERFLRATGFGLWELYQKLVFSDGNNKFDIVFTLDYPHRNESKRPFPHLMVLDIKKSINTKAK